MEPVVYTKNAEKLEAVKMKAQKSVKSLFNCALESYLDNITLQEKIPKYLITSLESLPPTLLLPVLEMIPHADALIDFSYQLVTNLNIVCNLLEHAATRKHLFKCMSFLICCDYPVPVVLQQHFLAYIKNKHNSKCVLPRTTEKERSATISFGLELGSFLSEAGWFRESITILSTANEYLPQEVCISCQKEDKQIIRLDCLNRLLHAQSEFNSFKCAESTFIQISNLLNTITTDKIPISLLVGAYTNMANMYFLRHEYKSCETWITLAMQNLQESLEDRVIVDTLRLATKICVIKCDYSSAHQLISRAQFRAMHVFGTDHPKYGDTLIDYALVLLRKKSACSITILEEAMRIIYGNLGNRSFHTANIHAQLAFAYYIRYYDKGNLDCAKFHIEDAINILKPLVPDIHPKLVSIKSMKAWILEKFECINFVPCGCSACMRM